LRCLAATLFCVFVLDQQSLDLAHQVFRTNRLDQ
jgi:hypothetical protein